MLERLERIGPEAPGPPAATPETTRRAGRLGGPGGGLQASEHRLLLIIGDAGAAIGAAIAALWIWSLTAGQPFGRAFVSERLAWLLIVVPWLMLLAPIQTMRAAGSLSLTVRGLARASAALMVGYLLLYFYAPRQALPRLVALYFVWEACLFTLAWRLAFFWLATETALQRRLVIVGAGKAGQAVLAALTGAGLRHLKIVGFVDDRREVGRQVEGVPVLGDHRSLREIVARESISEVILTPTLPPDRDQLQLLLACREGGVDVVPMSTIYEQLLRRVPIHYLDSDWLLRSLADTVRSKDASKLVKRGLDAAGAVVGLGALAGLTPVLATLIWLDSGRPIFFRQRRVGLGGHPFVLTKFRTMVPDAEPDGARWAAPADPRVTRIGRLLRRTRLDELPQCAAVLRGDMSLVGPRPERPEFVSRLEEQLPFYRVRLHVRPGMTGWAQVNHPYGDSVEDAAAKLEYDLYYVKHRSLLLDVWILIRTVGTVLRLRGT